MQRPSWSSRAGWAAALVLVGAVGGSADDISPDDLWGAIFAEEPPLVVDVREPEPFAKLRIPRSRNAHTAEAIAALTLQEGQAVVLVAQTEDEARAVAARVNLPGHAVRVLRGGLEKWPWGLELNAEELHRRREGEKPPQLVDVRTLEEFEACRIPGTVHHPLDQIETWGPALSQTEEIVLVCRTGRRSGLAQEWLARHGFRRVHNLLGGTAGWTYERLGPQCAPQG